MQRDLLTAHAALLAAVAVGALAAVTGTASSTAQAAALTPGNVLVTTENFGAPANALLEYTTSGALVQSFTIPYGSGSRPVTEDLRDAVVDAAGQVHMYNGTFTPFLTSFNPVTSTATHQQGVGFSTVANISYGGIAMSGQSVFVTDMATSGSAASGIVRIDLPTMASTRFATTEQPIDLTLGQDGLLYSLPSSSQITVYNPATNAFVRTINLDSTLSGADIRGIAVDAAGSLYAAAWDGRVYKGTSAGVAVGSISTGSSNLQDIDLSPSGGQLVIGGRFGGVFFTNTNLSTLSSFTSSGANPIHVAWTSVPEPVGIAATTVAAALTATRRRRRR